MIKESIFAYCIALLVAASAEPCSAETQKLNCDDFLTIKKTILIKLNDINDYKLDATVSIDNNVAHAQIIGRPPDRLRITQRLHKGAEELTNIVVFDGQNQWVESKFLNKVLEVSKIRLSEVVDAGRPFDTGYYIQGAGIFGGEDFPSTVKILLAIYDLSATCSSHKTILSGYLIDKKFEEYSRKRKFARFNKEQGFRDQYKKNFKYAYMVFHNTDCLLHEYTLGPSKNSKRIKVTFQHIKLNFGGLEDEFDYQVPKGFEPTDITDELKQALKND